MEGQGRIQCVLIATTGSNIVYERFYERFTDIEKADIRHSFQQTQSQLTQSSTECIGRCRSAVLLNLSPINILHRSHALDISMIEPVRIAGQLQLWPMHKATLYTMQQAQESMTSLHVSLASPQITLNAISRACRLCARMTLWCCLSGCTIQLYVTGVCAQLWCACL